MATHNAHTEAVRAATLAAMQSRPVIPEPVRDLSAFIAESALHDLRNMRRLLKNRPDLTELLDRSGGLLSALHKRLADEAPKGLLQ